MVFRLEAEALEHERLATLSTSPPPATEQIVVPSSEGLTTTAQEVLAMAQEVSLPRIAQTTDTMVAPTTDAPIEMITPTQAQPDHPATAPDPENILDILIEDCDKD